MNSGYIASKYYGGTNVIALENKICQMFDSKAAIAVNSGTSGLWCAIANYLYGSVTGRQVIVTPYSMSASSVLPLLFGAAPVFCDIEPEHFCIDPNKIKALINCNTIGIIAVDLFGHPYSEQIDKIAYDNGLWVIEDACQAIGAKRHGKYCGTLGDIGILSFNEHKHISCGEGGMILCQSVENEVRLREWMNHGEVKGAPIPGMNLRMTENNAAMVLERLDNFDNIIERYREIGQGQNAAEDCISSYYKLYTFDEDYANANEYQKGYVMPIHMLPLFLGHDIKCPVCEDVQRRIWTKDIKEMI